MEMLPNVRLTDGRTDVFGYSSGGEGDKQQRNQYKHRAATERALASPRENGSTTFHNYRPKYPQKIVHAISAGFDNLWPRCHSAALGIRYLLVIATILRNA